MPKNVDGEMEILNLCKSDWKLFFVHIKNSMKAFEIWINRKIFLKTVLNFIKKDTRVQSIISSQFYEEKL